MLQKENDAAVHTSCETAAPVNAFRVAPAWEKMLPLLQKELGLTAYKSWIAPVVPVRFEKGVLELAVATRFIRDWVKTHYADRIRHLWAQQFGSIIRVDIVISAAQPVVLP